jgi:membrane peptidoglycan carboxypeptidase
VKPAESIGDQVISREAADSVTSVLTGVVDDGTAQKSVRDNPERKGQKVAGKTGTSDDNKSAWFTGYTPDLVTSVGLFGESAKPPHPQVTLTGATGLIPGKGRINGGGYPAQIWAAYTFGVSSKVTKFDLETDQGAAVQPSISASPSPSKSEEPSEEPSSEEPTPSRSPQTPTTPSQSPTTEEPSEEPTTEEPSGEPSTEEPSTAPENPLDPQTVQ